MKRITKIPAFTLTELLVVLTISSLVIGLAYALLAIFNKNLLNIENNYARTTNHRLFEEQINIDFNSYGELWYSQKEKRMIFRSPIDSITYRFEDEVIFRSTDTIYPSNSKLNLYYLGTEVSSGRVDAIKFWTDPEKDQYFFVSKRNDVSELLDYGN